MTAGVSTTASAKLNSSARRRSTPASSPVEIVAPEREKPRNGRQRPWTAPIQAAPRVETSASEEAARRDDAMISRPAAADGRAGDEPRVPEQLLDLEGRSALGEDMLDELQQRQSDQAGHDGRQRDELAVGNERATRTGNTSAANRARNKR